MTEYLSKEEIKQWRSSLEKITLEEFAARLGKSIEPPKSTHDIADIVLKGKPVSDMDKSYSLRAEKLSTIAQRAMEREQEILTTPFSMKNIIKDLDATSETPKSKSDSKKEVKNSSSSKKSSETSVKKSEKKSSKSVSSKVSETEEVKMPSSLREEVHFVFKKVLTEREQRVFDYFLSHKGEIVYAKDLATLLNLPKDYVYKYIKNIRSKVDGAELQNAEQGGFLLKK
ncbi:hypothetical protein J6S88_06095 [bacterium]|nr:hypothetical protein [bacterium]